MNKDTLIGFVLIAVVLIGFSWWNQPSQEEIEAYQHQQDSIAAVEKDKAVKQQMAEQERKDAAEAALKGDTTALFYSALNGENQQVVLENEKVELTFDTTPTTCCTSRCRPTDWRPVCTPLQGDGHRVAVDLPPAGEGLHLREPLLYPYL